MSAPEQIYGPNNLARTQNALRYATDTRDDRDTLGAVRDEDVKTALRALLEDEFFIACMKSDYRAERLKELGRLLDTQITIARANRLQWPMP